MINNIEKVENNNETRPLRGILIKHDKDDDYKLIQNRTVYICLILLWIFILTPLVIACSIRFWI